MLKTEDEDSNQNIEIKIKSGTKEIEEDEGIRTNKWLKNEQQRNRNWRSIIFLVLKYYLINESLFYLIVYL